MLSRNMMRCIVRINVVNAVSKSLSTTVMSVPEVRGNWPTFPLTDIPQRFVNSEVSAIRLWGCCYRNYGFTQNNSRLRHSDHCNRLRCRNSRGEHFGCRHSDIFRSANHDASRDKSRIFTCFKHARKIVDSGINIRSAHRLNESACHVVVLILIPTH